jgi:CAAX prenyl protease-like protein
MGLWNAGPMVDSMGSVLGVFAIAATIITVAVWRVSPQILFGFVRNYPRFWALVMVLYPVLSVYPQGIIYRGFFFQRYQPLFRSPAAMVLASAAAFAFSHLIFRSPWSVALTFAGGANFRASIRSFLFPASSKAFLRGSHASTSVTCGFTRSWSQAAQVPSSKHTCKLPCSRFRNCSTVAVSVSSVHSRTSLPVPSKTAAQIVAR